jgi:hypothetical protein
MNSFIFWVVVFQLVENRYKMRVHFVAAESSKQAEEKINKRAGTLDGLLRGHAFIMTDEYVQNCQQYGVETFVTEMKPYSLLSDREFSDWKIQSIYDMHTGDELLPATYRSISK